MQSFSFGGKIGWQKNGSKCKLQSYHFNGRYLMQREWGKDPFFTFMPRERNERFGNVDTVVTKLNFIIPKPNLIVYLLINWSNRFYCLRSKFY